MNTSQSAEVCRPTAGNATLSRITHLTNLSIDLKLRLEEQLKDVVVSEKPESCPPEAECPHDEYPKYFEDIRNKLDVMEGCFSSIHHLLNRLEL